MELNKLQKILRKMTNWQNSQWNKYAENRTSEEEAKHYLHKLKSGRDESDFHIDRLIW